jgi:hypothetical protein
VLRLISISRNTDRLLLHGYVETPAVSIHSMQKQPKIGSLLLEEKEKILMKIRLYTVLNIALFIKTIHQIVGMDGVYSWSFCRLWQ